MTTETPSAADRLDDTLDAYAPKRLDRNTRLDAIDAAWDILKTAGKALFPGLAVDPLDPEGPAIWDVTTPHRPELAMRRNQANAVLFDGLEALLPRYEVPEVEPVAADVTKSLPKVLQDKGVEVLWVGADSKTLPGYVIVDAEFLGLQRTYLCRNGEVVGRAELGRRTHSVYLGGGLLGGLLIGSAPTLDEAQKLIADRASKEG